MKKTIITLMIMAFILINPILAMASTPIEDIVFQQQIDKTQDLEAIQKAINVKQACAKNFFIKERNISKRATADEKYISFGVPFKVYTPPNDFVQNLIDGKPVSDLLAKSYYFWEVPVLYQGKPVDSMQVAYFKNKYKVVQMGSELSPEGIALSCNPQAIINVAKNNSIKTANSFVHIRLYGMESDYLYFATEDGEYFYSLLHGERQKGIFGLQGKTFYTRQQIADIIAPLFKQRINNLQL